ncbi:hypothetical protein RhiirA5_503840 [Rhizophagus irregularis]|uniref:Uncharacterized protein n=1 Tax=Rhizophagus irregularis TaxID=588596 RepID=A0A2N0SCS3_9GLOM|nr:hypothetical protein RhiirA5_503840 [Rhizophagus irregularis]PKC73334.1 hypothetical protein RhiirA1_530497 [Rhizophagus irregularis]
MAGDVFVTCCESLSRFEKSLGGDVKTTAAGRLSSWINTKRRVLIYLSIYIDTIFYCMVYILQLIELFHNI